MSSAPRLSLREKLSYGCGDFASMLYWQTFMSYLLVFYTDVFGLGAAAVGTMLLVSRVWDATIDPVMGMIADRTQSRWGRFRPYLLWGAVPLAIVGVLTFTTPALGGTGKVVWAYATFVSLMTLYTVVNIPYTAMLGVMTADAKERTSLASIKFLFAYASGVLASATLLPLVRTLGQGTETRGWQLAFVVFGVAAVGLFLVTFFGTRERIEPPAAQRTSIGQDVRDLFRNGPWVVLLATTLLFILFVATRLSATAHYFKYVVGTRDVAVPLLGSRTLHFEELVSAFNAAGQVASIAGVVLVPWFSGRVGKKRTFALLFGCAIAATAGLYLVPPSHVTALFALQIVGSLCAGPLSAVLWSMYADTADYGEWQNGRRATGLVFSASIMAQKFGWAFSAALAGWMLDLFGFKPNVEQPAAVTGGLTLLMSLIPAALGLGSMALLAFYPLSDRRMAAISEELAARRRAATSTASLVSGNP